MYKQLQIYIYIIMHSYKKSPDIYFMVWTYVISGYLPCEKEIFFSNVLDGVVSSHDFFDATQEQSWINAFPNTNLTRIGWNPGLLV